MSLTKTTQLANRYGLNTKLYAYSGYTAGTSTPVMTIDFANLSNIDISGDMVWATGGQSHGNIVGFNNKLAGTFRLSTQIITSELLTLIAGGDVAEATNTIVFKNDAASTIPHYFVIESETSWQDKDGTIYEEKLTFHKAIAKRALNIEYNGDGDPVSVDIEFELGQNDDGYVLTITRDNVAASKYTISATAGSHGSVSPASIEVAAGSTISVSGNVLTCDSKTITATPASGYVANWAGVQPKANADIAVSVTFTQEQA